MRGGIAVLLVLFCLLAGCSDLSDPAGPSSGPCCVRYIASGSAGRADITISNANGDLVTYEDRVLPWTHDLIVSHYGHGLHITGESCNETGCITVRVYMDGLLRASATCDGPYACATAETPAG
jgi:hypothetical protein